MTNTTHKLQVIRINKVTNAVDYMSINRFIESKPWGKKVSFATLREMVKGSWYQDLKTGYFLASPYEPVNELNTKLEKEYWDRVLDRKSK